MACDTWRTLLFGFGAPAQTTFCLPFASLTATVFETLKELFFRYTEFVWTLVEPLGSWAVFAIAGIDSAFWGFPLDPLVAGYVYRDQPRFLLYAIMAAAGSAVGSIVLYIIGYKGGEVLLAKRIPAEKFDRIRNSFDQHEFWALMFPSMMPPPFPFKVFVLAASVFEMNFWHFLLAIFAGRLVRFLLLSVLVLKFGAQVLTLIAVLIETHWHVLLLTVVGVAGICGWVWYRSRRRTGVGETAP
jgi:membrane protein YqaA with SNARE-associated domain